MPSNVYHFVNRWFVPHAPEEVWEVLTRVADYPKWWGKVYLKVDTLDGPEPRVGSRVAVLTKGWMPYRLRWTITTKALERPGRIEVSAVGDFNTDSSQWVLTPKDGGTEAALYWNPRVEKRLVKLFSPVLKPLFKSNHYWAMDQGQKGIVAYMASRRAT
jgi:uncharacterized protein YndB with AHSA1/START domain